MKERTRRIFIMIVMAALIVSLMAASFAALTYGRYSGGRFDENSPYEDYIDFVGATAYEVRTPEQFVNAINNGYSYIKIAADAEGPFVVNDDIANVTTNLVLDVNGHKIVRNSRNPLLDVKRSVSVVLVYDSSTEQEGGFYNPVGSALQTSGGTLTVGAGSYESGPNEEYQTESYQTGQQVTLFDRGETRMGSYPETGTLASNLPILTGKNAGTQEDPVSVYDFYFESAPEGNVNSLIEADTYLIYTKENNCYKKDGQLLVNCTKTGTEISGTPFSVESNVASCDFYYYYPVGTANEDGFYTYAVVYGYNDVKNMAADVEDMATALVNSGLVWPYAAIRSEAGNTHARGGKFSTHFGTQNTCGIYSKGGIMTVGADSANSAPSFTATGAGVCIRMSGDENNTLTISNGSFSSKIGNTVEMSGGTMTVTAGTFEKDASSADTDSTDNGSAISISGGSLNMTGTEANPVSFDIKGDYVNGIKMEKAENDATANIADTIENAAFSFNKESGGTSVAAIQVRNGLLNVRDSTFDFNGGSAGRASANNGIYVQGGSVKAENCTFTLSPNGSVTGSAAIASAGGNVTAEGCNFVVNGYSNYGVFSSGGEITATDCDFTMTQAGPSNGRGDNFGIYSMRPEGATKGGTATAEGCTINITGTYSAGVLSMDGTLNLGASKTKETSITVSFEGNELSSSGVSSEGGEINLTGNTTITSAGLGITARGEINVTGGTSTVKTERGTGIYVQNGTLTVSEGATVDVDSEINDTCSWVTPPEHVDEGEQPQTNKYNGVYVNGGSLVSNGTLNVTFTGVQNDSQYIDASGAAVENVQAINNIHHYENYDPAWENWRDDLDYKHTSDISSYTTAAGIIEANGNLYQRFQTKSYAVRVQNGDVNIKSGLILNGAESDLDENGNIIGNHGIGGGIIVDGGSVTLGEDNGGLRVITTGARMIERQYYWEDNSVTTSEWIRDSILVWEGQHVTRHDYNVTTRNYIKVPGAYQNWAYREPETGGDAVKVIGGQVTVESGRYEAAQGNGILVSGATTTAREYAVEISGGTFVGNDTYDAYGEAEGTAMPGAGASYGLKMYGGSVQITGGRFGSDSTSGSGAFIMGSAAGTQRDATAYITGGTFNVPRGTAGLSVWYGADVQIEGGTFYGRSAGMTVEDYNDPNYGIIVGDPNAYTEIYIGGSITRNTFDGGQDDIWHGGRYTTLSVPRGMIGDIAMANGAIVTTR